MEALRQDDPRRFGPYTVLARLRGTAGSVQYLARDAASEDAVVLTAARPELAVLPAFRRRFQAEARTADRLTGGWVQPQLGGPGAAGDEELPWTATAYVPALTLAEAIDATGPLPERTVRILGAGLAETLSRVHATGAVLQGLAPGTVLLAEDGPRLTAFGPLGAAAAAEARPGGQLSVRLGYLTPEQVAGEEPGPPSDLFVLGLLLAYAATGTTPLADGPAAEGAERIARTAPELGAVPEELRDLIARCLEKSPADRPTAGTVAAELALEGAAGLARDGWLPEALAAALAEQGVRARATVTAGALPEAPDDAEGRTESGATAEAEAGADRAGGTTGEAEDGASAAAGARAERDTGAGTAGGTTAGANAGTATAAGEAAEAEDGTSAAAGARAERDTGAGTAGGTTAEAEDGTSAAAGARAERDTGAGTAGGTTAEANAGTATAAGEAAEAEDGTSAAASARAERDTGAGTAGGTTAGANAGTATAAGEAAEAVGEAADASATEPTPARVPTQAPTPATDSAPSPSPSPVPVPTQAPTPTPDTQTAQLGAIGRHAPRADRPTTQLSVPQELTGRPAAATPALPPGTTPALPAGPTPARPGGLAPALPGGPTPALPVGPSAAPSAVPSAGMPGGVPAVPPPMVPVAPLPLPIPSRRTSISTTSSSPAMDRRTLLIGLAAGAAGLVVGGGGVLALGGGDGDTDAPEPTPDHSGPTIAGLPPQPRWVYTHPAAEPAPLTAAVWNDRLLVLTTKTGATAVDLRTGRRTWQNADAAEGQTALPVGKDLCFVATPSGFLWLSPKDGKTVHRVAHADLSPGTPKLSAPEFVGASGPVIWFTGSEKATVKAPPPKKGKKRGKDKQVVRAYLFAYDLVRREQLWRAPVPAGRGPGTPVHRLIAVRQDDLVIRQSPATLTPGDVRDAKGKAVFRSFDRSTGKALWTKQFGTVAPDAAVMGDDRGLLYAAVGDDLRAFETPGGKPKWTLNGTGDSPYGTPVATGAVLHTTNRNQEVGAVERETGRLRWRRSTEAAITTAAPAVTLSTTGRTLLASDGSQVTAFAAEDGRRLWKFQDIGAQDPKGPTVTAPYRVLTTGRTAVVQRDRIFYAFPVA
ncbi:PQQ-binding-like beta-propeller repeat protein [Streptomyces sp. NPDC057697]|uniref:outer membrane protein assembly factor BamB family protein n=1 Tax=Streptomyces sp. NPDC057697 TaxID=3346219 RepID=UPI00368D294F